LIVCVKHVAFWMICLFILFFLSSFWFRSWFWFRVWSWVRLWNLIFFPLCLVYFGLECIHIQLLLQFLCLSTQFMQTFFSAHFWWLSYYFSNLHLLTNIQTLAYFSLDSTSLSSLLPLITFLDKTLPFLLYFLFTCWIFFQNMLWFSFNTPIYTTIIISYTFFIFVIHFWILAA
jgi:hypothetical protein